MKLGIITVEDNNLVNEAEKLQSEIEQTPLFEGKSVQSEIIIESKQGLSMLLKKFSKDDLLIWFNPLDSSEKLARSCLMYSKWLDHTGLVFYISSCQESYNLFFHGNAKVKCFKIEKHDYLAKQITDTALRHTVVSALPKEFKRLSEEDYGTPAD